LATDLESVADDLDSDASKFKNDSWREVVGEVESDSSTLNSEVSDIKRKVGEVESKLDDLDN
jgi:hypothetical protein